MKAAPLIRMAALALLLCLPAQGLAAPPAVVAAKATGPLRGLVVLTQFPGLPHAVDSGFVRQRFAEFLDGYVREMSGGAAWLDIELTPWITLPDPVERYRISPRNLEVDKSRVGRLLNDALSALPAELDLARYDFVALMLGATASEYGMVGLCGYPGMLGWSRPEAFRTRSGRVVRSGVAIFTSQAHPGTLFHDVAHILGGVQGGQRVVPCLYDHDLQARPGPPREVFAESIINLGFWDPMSCHFYKRELPPPGISAWTRLRLGWLAESKVRTVPPGSTEELLLSPLEDPAGEILAVRIPVSDTSEYLVENRQPLSYDRNLPGSGVLIMRTDRTVAECRHGASPVKLVDADPAAPRLTGAAFDAGARNTFVDTANNVKIQVLEQAGGAFRLRISPP